MKDLISDITKYMREHIDRDISIEELAVKYGYSKYYFSREFKKALGVTPNEYWAALRMERSLMELDNSSSILSAHLKTGYQSTGTFSSSFQKATGFTPGQYQDEMQKLSIFRDAKEFEEHGHNIVHTYYSFDKNDPSTIQEHVMTVVCHLPDDFKGLIFFGLFPKPLSADMPVLGKAMTDTNICVIDRIPDGEYYALVCAIKSNTNPLTYFQPKLWLRDLHRTPYRFPLRADTTIELTLRGEDPTDPAIALNPVKLLVEVIRGSRA